MRIAGHYGCVLGSHKGSDSLREGQYGICFTSGVADSSRGISGVVNSSCYLDEKPFYSYFTPTLSTSLPLHLPLNSLSLWELKDSYFYSYFTPDYIIPSCNSLIYKYIRKSVRVSFSAPNASQQCGAFLFVATLKVPVRVQRMDLYERYWPCLHAWVPSMDPYEH